MRYSPIKREFIGFTIVALFGVAGLVVCSLLFPNYYLFWVFFPVIMTAAAILFIGVIGVIWTLVEYFVAKFAAGCAQKQTKTDYDKSV
jgi:phosphotransferase system  glucose/maltose/N-acetylglucosamine-specific IIC component